MGGVKRKGPWRSLGDCRQGPRSVCVRGAELAKTIALKKLSAD
jgi:hypothetical protein